MTEEIDKLLVLVRAMPEEYQRKFIEKVGAVVVALEAEMTMTLEERQELRRLQSEKTWARIRGQVDDLKRISRGE